MCFGSVDTPSSPETLGSASGDPTLAKVVHDFCTFDSRSQKYEAPTGTEMMVGSTAGAESQSGTLGQVQKSRLLGTQNFRLYEPLESQVSAPPQTRRPLEGCGDDAKRPEVHRV
jgi:hypothetical protein